MFSNVNSHKNLTCFICHDCDYITSRKNDYDKHLHTIKHNSNVKQSLSLKKSHKVAKNRKPINDNKIYICQCGKSYVDNSGLWRHKKICLNLTKETNIETNDQKLIEKTPEKAPDVNTSEVSDKEIIKLLIQENSDFKNLILELIKKDTMNITNNNTNSHNKTFNLQFFLNEECKDALNISEFVSSIRVELDDLEATGRLGYVEGVSRIINKNLSDLDANKRPIHCSDLKREVLYIKNDDQWTKEDESKPILKKAIKEVANENIKQISEWRKKHPDCTASDSRKNDQYLKIVSNSMSGMNSDEQIKNINKIITNVAKETVIDK